jgi:hypothetical protein
VGYPLGLEKSLFTLRTMPSRGEFQ